MNVVRINMSNATHKNILDMVSTNVIMKERTPLYGNLKLLKTITKDCV